MMTPKDRPTVRQQLAMLAELYWLLLLMAGDRLRQGRTRPNEPVMRMVDRQAPPDAASRAA